MEFTYAMNWNIYEIGLTLIREKKSGKKAVLLDVLQAHKNKLGPTLYAVFEYGLRLVLKGLDNNTIVFLMTEYQEQIKLDVSDSYELMKDVRLVTQFILWLNTEEDMLNELLNELIAKSQRNTSNSDR